MRLHCPVNGYETELADSIGSDDLECDVAAGTAAALEDYLPTIVWINSLEAVEVTEITDDTLTIVRAQEGTDAVPHAAGASVECVVSAEFVTELQTELTRIQGLLNLLFGQGSGVIRNAQVPTALKVTQTDPAGMRVTMAAGYGWVGGSYLCVSEAWTSAALVAPSAHPRIDLVQIKVDTGPEIKTGEEADIPSAPAADANAIASCKIHWRVGATKILDTDDSSNAWNEDVRVYL